MSPHDTICPHCGTNIGIQDSSYLRCYHCGKSFILVQENIVRIENTISSNLSSILPVLKKGDIVQLINEEHPWNNELALICDRKHKYYRIEILGKRLWVPEDWVRKTDEPSADSNN